MNFKDKQAEVSFHQSKKIKDFVMDMLYDIDVNDKAKNLIVR